VKPNLQKVQLLTRRKDARHRRRSLRQDDRLPAAILWDAERCPVRVFKEMSSAPRGALSYSWLSREELGGMFLDLMPYLDSKDEGNGSMAGNQRSCPGVRSDALRDPRDMAKAGLPEAQSPDDATPHPPERRLKPVPTLRRYPIHADATSRVWSDAQRGHSRRQTGRLRHATVARTTRTNVGSPKGREPHGDGVPIVVVGVTTHRGERESRSHGRSGTGV
jgi:hypothetical protein